MDAGLYDAFDYVALGHIHKPQNVGRSDGTMRYCGTPLAYSRSELAIEKSVTLVELGAKGDVSVRTVPLTPRHPMHHLRGSFDTLMRDGPAPGTEDHFFFITLTDEEDIPNAAARLRTRFGQVLEMDYDNSRTRGGAITVEGPGEGVQERSPLELLTELYRLTHGGQDLSPEAAAFAASQIERVEGWRL